MPSQYDAIAELYDQECDIQDDESTQKFFELMKFSMENREVLDLASGTGRDLKSYTDKGANVYAAEASSGMMEVFGKNYDPNAYSGRLRSIIRADMSVLPFGNNVFDYVFSKWALQDVPDLEKVFQEVARVLKVGGVFYFLTKHPMQQFLEQKKPGRNYFKSDVVESVIFEGKITLYEPMHQLTDYLSPTVLSLFHVRLVYEGHSFPASTQVDGDTYPSYLIIQLEKK